jgi:hypothetical protein
MSKLIQLYARLRNGEYVETPMAVSTEADEGGAFTFSFDWAKAGGATDQVGPAQVPWPEDALGPDEEPEQQRRIVFVAFKNSIDWFGPPPTFMGVRRSVKRALTECLGLSDGEAKKWMDGDAELRGYYSVRMFDALTGAEHTKDGWSS